MTFLAHHRMVNHHTRYHYLGMDAPHAVRLSPTDHAADMNWWHLMIDQKALEVAVTSLLLCTSNLLIPAKLGVVEQDILTAYLLNIW